MKTKAIDAAQKEMQQILDARAAEIAALEDQIAAEAQAIQKHDAEMVEATDQGDVKAYQTAKGKRQNVADAHEMHSARLSKVTDQPLIDADKYNAMTGAIMEEMRANTDTAAKKLKELTDQIKATGDDLRKTGIEANNVMRAVQSDLYNNADRPLTNDGKRLAGYPIEFKDNKYFETLQWANAATERQLYKQLCEEGGNHGK